MKHYTLYKHKATNILEISRSYESNVLETNVNKQQMSLLFCQDSRVFHFNITEKRD